MTRGPGRAGLFLPLLLYALCWLPGCGTAGADEDVASAAKPERTGGEAGGRRVALRHAFGLVRPGTELRYRFHLPNPTAGVWTIEKVEPGCSCTGVALSRREIGPGEEALIDVTLKAGDEVGDREMAVRLRLREPTAPEVLLSITAAVRREMTCHPQEVALTDRARTAVLNVFNYSGEDWSSLVASPSAGWLAARCELTDEVANVPKDGPVPRQTWRLRVTAREGAVGETGAERLRLWVPGREFASDVLVQYRTEPVMRAAPAEVFFGECPPGVEVTKKVLLLFRDGAAPAGPDGVIVRCSPGGALKHALVPSAENSWQLELTLAPDDRGGPSRGEVSVRLADRDEMVRIPYSAIVSRR